MKLVLFLFISFWAIEWADVGRPVQSWTQEDWLSSLLRVLRRMFMFPFILVIFGGLILLFSCLGIADWVKNIREGSSRKSKFGYNRSVSAD